MIKLEDYLDSLEKQNGYCSCPEMQELYNIRKTVEIGFHMKEKSINKLIAKYNAKLSVLINKEKLELILHDPITHSEKKISHLDLKSNQVITVHCPKCHNQIDVLS